MRVSDRVPDRIYRIPGLGTIHGLSLERTICEASLRHFVRCAWPIVEPQTPISWNWHLDVLCDALERAYRGEIKRLIINVPPGTGKSMLVSVMWPAWIWTQDPSHRFLLASYTDHNPIRDNRRCRDIILNPWFQSHWPIELSKEGEIRFDTTAKGWRIATSVGGVGTGEHPDAIIIDDPLKAQDSTSDVKLESANNWISKTISTRVARDPAIVLVMQRLHQKDPTGFLLGKGGWTQIKFPMRYQVSRPAVEGDKGYTADPRDIRTEDGELLWPSQWYEEKIAGEELLLGPYGSSGQLGQEPIPQGGGLFRRADVEFVDEVPADAVRCRGWDTADTKSTTARGHWTVGVKIAYERKTKIYYVEHVIRVKESSSGVDKIIKDTAESDGFECLIREGSGSGEATINKRREDLSGYDYAPSKETAKEGNKAQRAGAFRTQWEGHNVRIKRGPWNEAYLDVMESFPVGQYDDDADASANAFNGLVGLGSGSIVW